jgi:hypothetical protein
MQSKLFLLLLFLTATSISFQSCTSGNSEEKTSEANKIEKDTTILSSNTETEAQDNEAPKPSILGTFESGDCSKHVEKDFSCECSFGIGDPYKSPRIFVSDWDESACVKIKGELNALYPDWEERDYKKELKQLAESKTWIKVNDATVEYFGKPLEAYKYGNALDLLINVILASGKDITEIPVENNSAAITAITTNAITQAKMYKSKGGDDPLSIVKYDNRSYDVFVRYIQITQNEGEANQYEGTITLLPNRGTEILETQKIKGNCGC